MDPKLLLTPITYLKGVGPRRAEILEAELGIATYRDLLHFFPNRYIDRTKYYTISELERNSAEVQIKGQITEFRIVDQKKGKRLVATFTDPTGSMELVWFRGYKWIAENLKKNTPYVIFGRTNWFNNRFSMAHPEMELWADHESGFRLFMQPVYPSTEKLLAKGVTNRVMNKMVQQLMAEANGRFVEILPARILEEFKLLSKSGALRQIHFPKSQALLAKAQFRLKFEELFFIQLQLLRKKLIRQTRIKGFVFEQVGNFFNTFYSTHLPFELTNAQKRVIREIRADTGSNAQMNRLLQGDVGSGKTVVALMAILLAVDNGFQACLMAPTEILAQQHYQSLRSLLGTLPVSISLLTGSVKKKDRDPIHNALEDGSNNILVGTHALLEAKVKFKNLGLAVIDEQHRFGVAQRAKLWQKNTTPPHILVMTATPIPRTLAMSLYGDLDISVIDELPPGRKPVKTVRRSDRNRLKLFAFLRDEIAKGRQVYIVYPLIRESESMDYKDLMDGYESIQRAFPGPDYQIAIVHGKMKPEDKDWEMKRFAEGKADIMVATTVIEVGVDIPNASVMVVESAERFGLSQLHQLRGRVGRGADQSYCVLMAGEKLTEDAQTRLNTMVATNDGFEIAEVDLRLRGPGDLMGTQQSGILQLKIADLVKDHEVLKIARYSAQQLLREDPELVDPTHHRLRDALHAVMLEREIWTYIS